MIRKKGKKDFYQSFYIYSAYICTIIFFGLSSSICLAKSSNWDPDDRKNYVLTTKYFRLTRPKYPAVEPIQVVDPRYPKCDFRKVHYYPEYYHHQFYGSFSLNCSQLTLDEFSSNGTQATLSHLGVTEQAAFPKGTFKSPGFETITSGAEIAIGYLWCNVRAEAEYFINSETSTTTAATISPFSSSFGEFPSDEISSPISVKLQTQAYFGNLYYDFMFSERIRPFVMCGLGMAVSTLKFSAQNVFSINGLSRRTYSLAFAAGLGCRVRIFPNCFLTTSYRYMRLGVAAAKSSALNTTAEDVHLQIPAITTSYSDLYQNTVSVGLMYLF